MLHLLPPPPPHSSGSPFPIFQGVFSHQCLISNDQFIAGGSASECACVFKAFTAVLGLNCGFS